MAWMEDKLWGFFELVLLTPNRLSKALRAASIIIMAIIGAGIVLGAVGGLLYLLGVDLK